MKEIISQQAANIVKEEFQVADIHDINISINILPIRTVGVQGDNRSYGHPLVLQFTEQSSNQFAQIPFEVLAKISGRITNEIGKINKVTLDITEAKI